MIAPSENDIIQSDISERKKQIFNLANKLFSEQRSFIPCMDESFLKCYQIHKRKRYRHGKMSYRKRCRLCCCFR